MIPVRQLPLLMAPLPRTTPPSDPLIPITVKIPASIRKALEDIAITRAWNQSNANLAHLSGPVNTALQEYVLRMQDPEYEMGIDFAYQLEEFHRILAAFPAGRTIGGAHQFTTPPDPEVLARFHMPAVLTTGEMVILMGKEGESITLRFDADANIFAAYRVDGPEEIRVEPMVEAIGEARLPVLCRVIGEISMSAVGLANGGPGAIAKLSKACGMKMSLKRLENGEVEVSLGGCNIRIPAYMLWRWAGELNAAMSRYMTNSLSARVALEDAMQAPAAEVSR